MAPKKRDRRPINDEQTGKRPRRLAKEAGQTIASQDVVAALAGALGECVAAMPPIRKAMLEGERVASVFDAIKAFRGRS